MIKKLRIKFLLLSMLATFLLLVIIIGGMNLINYNSVIKEVDETLKVLSLHKGAFPDPGGGKPNNGLPPDMSRETPYESRFFSLLVSTSGDFIQVDTSKISSVDKEQAMDYANQVLKETENGFIDNFRYTIRVDKDGQRIIFLDCTRVLDSYHNFLSASIIMGVIGFILVFVVIFIFIGRIVKPITDSYTKQKRFITDAGHELKTPLTIINANADILAMELDEKNECIVDIKKQVARLRTLTEDLVMLTRMEELDNSLIKIDFPLSEIITETIQTFTSLAKTNNRIINTNITPLITLNGDSQSIIKLTNILMDNALKYSQNNTEIKVQLLELNNEILFSVSNTIEQTIKPEQMKHLFDRFYRSDTSRNSEISGYGIGLSIAQAIVQAHSGKINVDITKDNLFQISVIFPKK